MNKKRLLGVLVAGGVIAAIALFLIFRSHSPGKIKFVTSKNAWCTLTVLAQKQGYFKEEGLDVNLEYVQAARFAMDALISGDAQLGNIVETNTAFLGYSGSLDVEIAATHCLAHDGAIVARRDAGISKPKDLEGKKLGILQGTTSQIFADRFIEKHGLAASNIQIVNLQPVVIQSSLTSSRDIDAGSLWQPFVFNVQKQLKDNAVVFNDPDVYTGYMNVAVSKDWGKQHAQLVEAALRAHLKAEKFARENRESAIGIVAAEIALDKDVLSAIWDEYVYRVHLSPKLMQEIRAEGRWIPTADTKFKDRPVPSYDGAVNAMYLNAVAPDRVEK